jgi:hypothetical protein
VSFPTAARARGRSQQSLEIKSAVLPELQMPLKDARRLLATPCFSELLVAYALERLRRHCRSSI